MCSLRSKSAGALFLVFHVNDPPADIDTGACRSVAPTCLILDVANQESPQT
jgi:hypothetical protein